MCIMAIMFSSMLAMIEIGSIWWWICTCHRLAESFWKTNFLLANSFFFFCLLFMWTSNFLISVISCKLYVISTLLWTECNATIILTSECYNTHSDLAVVDLEVSSVWSNTIKHTILSFWSTRKKRSNVTLRLHQKINVLTLCYWSEAWSAYIYMLTHLTTCKKQM